MNWENAIKVGGPSVIATFVFQHLIITYLDKSEIFKNSLALNVALIAAIFLFCIAMGWFWVKSDQKKSTNSKSTARNTIEDNEVDGNFKIGSSSDITDNKINKNKVKGDFSIGGKD